MRVNAALLHYAWYEKASPDDIGEPIHSLFRSLALYRAGDQIRAREKLLETMIQNIYLLPGLQLLRLPVVPENIWHSSGLTEPGYFHETPPEFVPAFSREEVGWIGDQLKSDLFRRMKAEYISTFAALKHEHNAIKRTAILDPWSKCRAERFMLAG